MLRHAEKLGFDRGENLPGLYSCDPRLANESARLRITLPTEETTRGIDVLKTVYDEAKKVLTMHLKSVEQRRHLKDVSIHTSI